MPPDPFPRGINAYTVIVLEHQAEYLLLRRSPARAFAPNRWTGVGGKVEAGEFDDLYAAALRELREETGLLPQDVTHFVLRRVMLQNRPGTPLTLLCYFTGALAERVTPACPEGSLAWVTRPNLDELDIIETSRPVIPALVDYLLRDPSGQEPPRIGLGLFAGGAFQGVLWSSDAVRQAGVWPTSQPSRTAGA